jgi:sulfoxide reductase heme-binding subunit YedZ
LKRIAALKIPVFIAALVPLALLVAGAYTGDLTANPIEYITHTTGWYALLFLTLTLCITPARRLTHWHWLIRFRRMLGLFAFFYATLHFLTWFVIDKFFSVADMAADVVKRPFITVGMTAYVVMVPLAVTSTSGWIRRLGGRRWAKLHQLVYVSALAAPLHFWWLVKSDVREPLRWLAVIVLLLGVRAWWTYRPKSLSRS